MDEKPATLRTRLAKLAGCEEMPPLFKGLKPLVEIDCDYDLSMRLLQDMFKER